MLNSKVKLAGEELDDYTVGEIKQVEGLADFENLIMMNTQTLKSIMTLKI